MPMRTLIVATATVALGLSLSVANALEEAGQAYITPMATYINPDGSISGDELEDGIKGGQLAVGFALADRWNIELAAQRLTLDGKNTSASLDQTGIVLNVLNVYNRAGRFSPYLIGGVGFVNDDAGGSVGDEDNFQAQGGLGLFTDLFGERVALRSEVLYRWEDATDSLGDWLVNVGFQVALGSRQPAPVAAAPVAAAVVAPAVDTDSDGDGVVDRLDQCPGTPKGATADSLGCPLDGDRDGVYDGIDKCPTTPRGAKVGPLGCSLSLSLSGVNFENDSAKLLPEGEKILDEAVVALKGDPAATIEIQGHTDSKGSDAYNMQLGESRANSVKDYLVAQGVTAGSLVVKSYGETEPVADNATPEGRADNRRVVLKALTFTETR